MKLIEKEPVIDPEDMDDETFCMHMSLRHQDSLGGLTEIWPIAEGTTNAWRIFHDRLHWLRLDLSHDHEYQQ
jgi:hypothetical protein